MENFNCGGAGPHVPGEVRVMPHTKDPYGGNSILCRACWQRELAYRANRNRELGAFAQYDLLQWENAKVYEA